MQVGRRDSHVQIFTHGSNQGSLCPQGQPGAKQLNTDKWTPAVKKGLVGGGGGASMRAL